MLLITDNSIFCPFQINAELFSLSNSITSNYIIDEYKYQAIFDWVAENTMYDHEGQKKRDKGIQVNYKTSLETFYSREGNCAELSFLYIVLARASLLESNFVLVEEDCEGDEVNHACATAMDLLVDLAYQQYGINHKKYRILNDMETSTIFNKFNQNS